MNKQSWLLILVRSLEHQGTGHKYAPNWRGPSWHRATKWGQIVNILGSLIYYSFGISTFGSNIFPVSRGCLLPVGANLGQEASIKIETTGSLHLHNFMGRNSPPLPTRITQLLHIDLLLHCCYPLVVFPDIWTIHLHSFPFSRALKGRTLTATFTAAPVMTQSSCNS